MTGIPYLDIIVFTVIIYVVSVIVVVRYIKLLQKQILTQQKVDLDFSLITSETFQTLHHKVKSIDTAIVSMHYYLEDLKKSLSNLGELSFLYEELLKQLQQKIGNSERESDIKYSQKFKDWANNIWENDGTIESHNKVVQLNESVRDRIVLVEMVIDIMLKELQKVKNDND